MGISAPNLQEKDCVINTPAQLHSTGDEENLYVLMPMHVDSNVKKVGEHMLPHKWMNFSYNNYPRHIILLPVNKANQ